MNSKRITLVLAILTVAGCTFNRTELRREVASLGRLGGGGQVIQPKRVVLRVIIFPRPLHDKAVNQGVWGLADEQALAPKVREALAANGLKVGILPGGLPGDVEAALSAKPPRKVDPAEFNLPDGDNTLVILGQGAPTASLLLTRNGRAIGRDYSEASGWFRVTASQEGATDVALRFLPEIHHGPVQRRYDTTQNSGGPMNSMEFLVKDGQQEETFREMLASLTLKPGQVAVLGCDPDRKDSLGSFLFTETEPNSDRVTQKVLIVSAVRTNMGEPGSQPKVDAPLEPVDPPDLPNPTRPGPVSNTQPTEPANKSKR